MKTSCELQSRDLVIFLNDGGENPPVYVVIDPVGVARYPGHLLIRPIDDDAEMYAHPSEVRHAGYLGFDYTTEDYMSTNTEQISALATIVDDFGEELLTMNRHDRNALMVALAAQQYFADVYPALSYKPLAACVEGLISEGEDKTTDAIEGILERFGAATEPERLALIQVLAQAIGGG
jgi:hypothetical protein